MDDDIAAFANNYENAFKSESHKIIIQQLEADLKRTREQLDDLINRTPEIESVHRNLRETTTKLQTAECTIETLKSRLKQVQNHNSELKSALELTAAKYNDGQVLYQAKMQENERIHNDLASKAERFAALNKAAEEFMIKASRKVGSKVASLDQALAFMYAPGSVVANEQFETVNQSRNSMKSQLKTLRKALEEKEEEQAQTIVKLTKQLRKANKLAEMEKSALSQEISEQKELMRQSGFAIEDLNAKNAMLKSELEEADQANAKLREQNSKLQGKIDEMVALSKSMEEKQEKGMKSFMKENEGLRDSIRRMQDNNLELAEKFRGLSQKAREISDSRDALKSDYRAMKACLEKAQDKINDQNTEISKLELENVSLASEVRSLKDKLVMAEAKIQQMETDSKTRDMDRRQYERSISIFESLLETQKADLCKAIKERNNLAERMMKLNSVLSREEAFLDQQKEHIDILNSKLKQMPIQQHKCEIPAHTCIGYLKEYLIPELNPDLQRLLTDVLDDSSRSVGKRIHRAFTRIAQYMNTEPSVSEDDEGTTGNPLLAHWLESFGADFNPSKKAQIADWICKLNPDNVSSKEAKDQAKAAIKDPKLRDLFTSMIAVNARQHKQIHELKEKVSTDMKTVEELIKSFGCDTNNIKDHFVKLTTKLRKEKQKVKQLRGVLEEFKAKIDENENGVRELKQRHKETTTQFQKDKEELKTKYESTVEHLRQKSELEVKQTKREYEKSATELKEKYATLQRAFESEKRARKKLEDELDITKRKAEAEKGDFEDELKSARKEAADIESRMSEREESYREKIQELRDKVSAIREQPGTVDDERYDHDVALLQKKLSQVKQQKKAIVAEFKKRFEDSEQSMRSLVDKLKESNSQIEQLREELCQAKIENQSLAFRLSKETDRGNCYGAMMRSDLYKNVF